MSSIFRGLLTTVLPLFLGGLLYLFRLDGADQWLKDWTRVLPPVYDFIRFHLADCLWTFGLVNATLWLWGVKITVLSGFFVIIAVFSGFLWEFYQWASPGRGTFDFQDAQYSLFAGLFAVLVNFKKVKESFYVTK